jgi:hypothetical protein
MAFDWQDNIALAINIKSLADSGALVPEEAAYRCVVGRAYYAAFGFAYDYAVQWLGFQPPSRIQDKSLDHGRLRAFYQSNRRYNVGRQLGALRDHRNQCDYQANLPGVNIRQLADRAIQLGQSIIAALPPPRRTP